MYSIQVITFSVELEGLLDDEYKEEYQKIARYLITLVRPEKMNTSEFRSFKRKALKFEVIDKILYRRAGKNVPRVRVIDSKERQNEILKELHEESGHRGREGTYYKISRKYWWPRLYTTCMEYCAACERCQKRASERTSELLYPTLPSYLWQTVSLDIVHMPPDGGYNYLVVAREHLSG